MMTSSLELQDIRLTKSCDECQTKEDGTDPALQTMVLQCINVDDVALALQDVSNRALVGARM